MKRRSPKSPSQRRISFWTTLVLGGAGLLVLSITLVLTVLEPPRGSALCASTIQRSSARSTLEVRPGTTIATLQESLKTSAAVVLDAMPVTRRVGVQPTAAAAVWESVRRWPEAVIDVEKETHEFEIREPLPPMRRGEKRGTFVIGAPGDAVYIRLDPLELGAIYALVGSSASGEASSIAFLDRHGDLVFRVVPGRADSRSTGSPSAFDATFQFMSTLPSACGP